MAQTMLEPTNHNGQLEIGPLKMWALGDRVLIQEDEFKSGYECNHCGGSGKANCGDCGGRGAYLVKGVDRKCSQCVNGAVICPECNGKGGLLVAPETSQRRPTTGRIVSLGEECKVLKLGQSILYSNFSGYVIDLKPVVLRILHESEVLCALEGQLDMRTLRGKSEIATFNN
jgi:co-chaperonin GroES (HSP10)